MITSLIAYLESVIQAHGAWGVLLATLIEEAVAPIPSALVPTAAGFFLIEPASSVWGAFAGALTIVAPAVAVGVTLGSSIIYAIAYIGGKPAIDRFGGWLGLRWKDIERVQQRFTGSRRDELILFVLRIIPIFPGFVLSGFCGAVRYPFARFALITFAGTFVRSVALGMLGWQAGEFYRAYFEMIDRIEGWLLIALIAAAAAFAVWHFVFRKRA